MTSQAQCAARQIGPKQKRCTKCLETKPASQFSLARCTRYRKLTDDVVEWVGLRSYCKPCMSAYNNQGHRLRANTLPGVFPWAMGELSERSLT